MRAESRHRLVHPTSVAVCAEFNYPKVAIFFSKLLPICLSFDEKAAAGAPSLSLEPTEGLAILEQGIDALCTRGEAAVCIKVWALPTGPSATSPPCARRPGPAASLLLL